MALINSFLDIVRTIRLNDIIDIAIMAFIFYKVLYFLARTGSGRVMRGILLLVLVMLLAKALELNRPKGMMVLVDVGDAPAIRLCESAGFVKAEGQNSQTATWQIP